MKAKQEHISKIHLVFDVENLSCRTDGHLLSFACVMFHADEGWMKHFNVALQQDRNAPCGHIDPGTVRWWIGQALQNPEAAVDTFCQFNTDGVDPVKVSWARQDLLCWVAESAAPYIPEWCEALPDSENALSQAFLLLDIQVWGHSPRVDILQLENGLFGGEGNGPWDFRSENDTRTLMKRWGRMNPGAPGLWEIADEQASRCVNLPPHSALRDAYRQAFMVIVDHDWLDRFPKGDMEPD